MFCNPHWIVCLHNIYKRETIKKETNQKKLLRWQPLDVQKLYWFNLHENWVLICNLSGSECIIFIPWYLPSDHVLWLNDNGVEELFKMAFHSGSWWMFRVLEHQPTWGLLKWCSVKQSARITLPHVLIRHLNHPSVNMIILANSSVEIIVFNLLVECAAEWAK